MRRVSIGEFRANMSKELGNLPFELTRDGKVIAEVCTKSEKVCTQSAVETQKFVQNDIEVSEKSDTCEGKKPAEIVKMGAFAPKMQDAPGMLSDRAKYRLKKPMVMCPKCRNRNKECVCVD